MSGPGTAPVHGASAEAGTYQRLRAHLAYLKLLDAAQALPAVLDQARDEGLGLTAALERLLGIEAAAVEARRQAGRLRFACLPEPWTLDQFDFAAQPGVDEALVRDLATLRFLDDATNVLLIGPPGVGKTMLAICLARAAVDAGHRVYFTSAADLAARCHRAALEGRWNTCMRFFAGPRLLRDDDRHDDVEEQAEAAGEEQQGPDDPDQGRIEVEVVGHTAGDAGDDPVVARPVQARAHQQPPVGSRLNAAALPSTARSTVPALPVAGRVQVLPSRVRPRDARFVANVS